VTLGKESSANNTSAMASLPSTFYRALGKDFAECHSVLDKEKRSSRRRVTETAPLQSVLGDTRQRSYLFVECLPARTQQRVHQRGPLSGSLPSALGDTRQNLFICRVSRPQHSAKKLYWCPSVASLSSAMALTLGKVTSIHLFYLFFIFHTNKQKISHIHHKYHIIITDITYTSHISQRP
jgi:hypothetical protein